MFRKVRGFWQINPVKNILLFICRKKKFTYENVQVKQNRLLEMFQTSSFAFFPIALYNYKSTYYWLPTVLPAPPGNTGIITHDYLVMFCSIDFKKLEIRIKKFIDKTC